jgi:hypothetical protein
MIEIMLKVIGLLAIFILGAYHLTKYLTKENPTLKQNPTPLSKEEIDNIKLAEELYNKELRPLLKERTKPQTANKLNLSELEIELESPQKVEKSKKKRKYYPKKKN